MTLNLLCSAEPLAQMLAIGLDIPEDTFTDAGKYGCVSVLHHRMRSNDIPYRQAAYPWTDSVESRPVQ